MTGANWLSGHNKAHAASAQVGRQQLLQPISSSVDVGDKAQVKHAGKLLSLMKKNQSGGRRSSRLVPCTPWQHPLSLNVSACRCTHCYWHCHTLWHYHTQCHCRCHTNYNWYCHVHCRYHPCSLPPPLTTCPPLRLLTTATPHLFLFHLFYVGLSPRFLNNSPLFRSSVCLLLPDCLSSPRSVSPYLVVAFTSRTRAVLTCSHFLVAALPIMQTSLMLQLLMMLVTIPPGQGLVRRLHLLSNVEH